MSLKINIVNLRNLLSTATALTHQKIVTSHLNKQASIKHPLDIWAGHFANCKKVSPPRRASWKHVTTPSVQRKRPRVTITRIFRALTRVIAGRRRRRCKRHAKKIARDPRSGLNQKFIRTICMVQEEVSFGANRIKGKRSWEVEHLKNADGLVCSVFCLRLPFRIRNQNCCLKDTIRV